MCILILRDHKLKERLAKQNMFYKKEFKQKW